MYNKWFALLPLLLPALTNPPQAPATATKARQKNFQIGIFFGPPKIITNDQSFRDIKDANVDYIQFVNDAYSPVEGTAVARNIELLKYCDKFGLKYYPADRRMNGSDKDIQDAINTYKNYPATAGYYIQDEPRPNELDKAAQTYKKLLALDPERTPYVNMLPSWSVNDYENSYLGKWVDKVGAGNLRFLSFDNYPFMEDGSFRESYYDNLDIIRRTGLKRNIPTSSYLQSVGIIGTYRRPNANELRYSAYSNVAYGVKNLVWFTYNTPGGFPPKEKGQFTMAIIDGNGHKSDLYPAFQQINGELQQLGKTLNDLNAVAVYHTGPKVPDGAQLPRRFFLKPQNPTQALIITQFQKNDGARYFMIVNKSFKENINISLNIDNSINNISEVSKSNGELVKRTLGAGHTFMITLSPGNGGLYRIN